MSRPHAFVALIFLLLLPPTLSIPAPVTRQQTSQPSVIPIPDPAPTDQPGGPPDISPTPSSVPTFTPAASADPFPTETASPEESPSPQDPPPAVPNTPPPNTDIDGRSSGTANGLSGGLIAGAFVIVVLIACLIFGGTVVSSQPPPQQPVYTSAAVKPPADPEGGETAASPDGDTQVDRDNARDEGPPAPPPEEVETAPPGDGNGGAEGGNGAIAAGAMGAMAGVPAGAIERGPTPPPHDYVLGAGPAATRNDFIDLRTKFEREEIGDNSAVLGLVGATLPSPRVEEGATTSDGPPDRGTAGVTFDSQERLMGGDGSGAVSDAAMSLGMPSIQEESGDVPSLERDPPMQVQVRKDDD